MNMTYDDLKFLHACGVDCWWMAGSMRFQGFIREHGTEEEKLRLHNLKVGCSFAQFVEDAVSGLSMYDRKFLEHIHVSVPAPIVYTDESFLRSVGVAPLNPPTAHEADISTCAARISKHDPPIHLDSTCQTLQELELGLPLTAEDWMRLNFAGRPPAVGEVDGEILAELPDFVRKVYDPDYEPDDDEDDEEE
jgi:hypothetical protein